MQILWFIFICYMIRRFYNRTKVEGAESDVSTNEISVNVNEVKPKPKYKAPKGAIYRITIENEIFLDSKAMNQMIMAKQCLSNDIIKLLVNRGYRIRMVPGRELDCNVAGDCIYSAKLIRISLDCHNDKGEVLLHEIGHMIDYEVRKSFISGSMAFMKIYQHEKMHFCNMESYLYEYYTKDEREYFAESFREYVLEPLKLKSIAPNTFDFIDKYVNSLRV